MSLYKRGSVWWIRFTKPNGGELRETTQTADRRHTWQEAVVRWLEEHQDRRGMPSVLSHLRHADPLLGDLTLDQITNDIMAKLVRDRRAVGAKPGTIKEAQSAVRAVLNAARAGAGWP